MKVRARWYSALIAALAAAAVLVPVGATRSAASASPTLYFTYAMNCTFTILDDSGKVVTSIPPGPYQIDIRTPVVFGAVPLSSLGLTDMTACKGFPQFSLTGPGVNIFTTLTAGCQSDVSYVETLQPNATYVAQDNNQPTVAHATFTTTSSGTASNPTAPGGGTGPSHGEVDTGLLGSGLKKSIGTLKGLLSSDGKLTLTNKGQEVSSLVAGRYTFAITDKDPKGSFSILGPSNTVKTDITGVKYIGTKSRDVLLKPGRWWYFSGLMKIHYFTVTKA